MFEFLVKICSQPIENGWCSRIPNLKENPFLPCVNNHTSKKISNDQKIHKQTNHNSHRKMNKNESHKSTTKEVLTWLKVSTPFSWKITHAWSSQILFENHTMKEYVHVKHEGHLLLSWSLSYVW